MLLYMHAWLRKRTMGIWGIMEAATKLGSWLMTHCDLQCKIYNLIS